MFNNQFLKTLNILYIESDKSINSHFILMLDKMFNNVTLIETLDDIDDVFKNIDIIVCDLYVNKKNSLSKLEEIKTNYPEIPIVLTALKYEKEDLIKAININISDFLKKPVNAKNLVKCIEHLCLEINSQELNLKTIKDLEKMVKLFEEVSLIVKTDCEHKITYVNDAFCKLTKFSKEELIGNTQNLIRDEKYNLEILKQIDKAVSNNERWEGKVRNITKDKEEFYSYLSVFPLMKNSKLEEYIWIRFETTQDELEQKEFKRKVAKNFHENRRINTHARDKIDNLMKKLKHYESLDLSIKKELERKNKFSSQNKYYENEIEKSEDKLKKVNEKAREKINQVVKDEKQTREQRDKAVMTLDTLTKELNLKTKTVKELSAELDKQKRIIEKLKLKIENNENKLGL